MSRTDPEAPREDALPREHHLTVARSARYVVLGEPAPDVGTVWMALHGYGQLAARFARHCVALAGADRLVVVPEALSRFYVEGPSGGSHAHARVGATWMTREDRLAEIGDYVAYLDQLHARIAEQCEGVPELRVLGFSQGAATAARWVAFGTVPPAALVLWGGLLPDDVDLGRLAARLGDAPVTFVVGEADGLRTVDEVRAQEALLRARGVRVRTETFAGGHALDAGVLAMLAERGTA